MSDCSVCDNDIFFFPETGHWILENKNAYFDEVADNYEHVYTPIKFCYECGKDYRILQARSYKNREVFLNDIVTVHRNLHKKALTIKKGTLVHAHAQMTTLYEASFHVNEKARLKVVESGRKNVHAYVKGRIIKAEDIGLEDIEAMYELLDTRYIRVQYNPYEVATFVNYETKEPIYKTDKAIIIMDRVYITEISNLA